LLLPSQGANAPALVGVVEVQRAGELGRSVGEGGLGDQVVLAGSGTVSERLLVPLDVEVRERGGVSAVSRVDDVALQERVIGHEVVAAVIAVAPNGLGFKKTLETVKSRGVGSDFLQGESKVLGIKLDEVVDSSAVNVLVDGTEGCGVASGRITSDQISLR